MQSSTSHGGWVDVNIRSPVTKGLKFTMTHNKIFGLACYYEGQWVEFLPTHMGEVAWWFEFLDDDGKEIEFLKDDQPKS